MRVFAIYLLMLVLVFLIVAAVFAGDRAGFLYLIGLVATAIGMLATLRPVPDRRTVLDIIRRYESHS